MKQKKNSLALKAPHLSGEFHAAKNIKSCAQVSYSSNIKIWWKCKNGHEWQASPGNRYRGTGCPNCAGRRLSDDNNFAKKCAHLICEWHPSKNGELSPSEVFPRGGKKVWWLCKNGHEWRASVGNRYNGTGCPDCAKKRLSSKYNLAYKYPELINEWHPEKNQGLKPDQIIPGYSEKSVWWLCEKGHEWLTAVRTRTLGGGKCPCCSGKAASPEYNLAVNFPELVPEWHAFKNNLNPSDVLPGSNKLIWWKCKFGHEWKAQVISRTRGHGCPKCNFRSSRLEVRIYCELKYIFTDALWQSKINKREMDIFIPSYLLCIEVDGWYWHKSTDRNLADKSKEIALKQNEITLVRVIDDRLKAENSKYFLSYKNGESEHSVVKRLLKFLTKNLEFSNEIMVKINNYLLGNKYLNEAEYENIFSCLPGPLRVNSIVNNEKLVNEWHPKNHLLPINYSSGSKSKAWWLCEKGHEWEATIGSRSAGRGCPFCSRKRACPEYNLLVKRPKLAKEFHPTKNKLLTLALILPRSKKKIWWKCKNGHEWQACVGNRYNGAHCPDCVGKKLSKNHNLAVKYPQLLDQWHAEKNFPLTPYDVTPKSAVKVWWLCPKGHEWQASIEKRTRGRGCHVCSGYKPMHPV